MAVFGSEHLSPEVDLRYNHSCSLHVGLAMSFLVVGQDSRSGRLVLPGPVLSCPVLPCLMVCFSSTVEVHSTLQIEGFRTMQQLCVYTKALQGLFRAMNRS